MMQDKERLEAKLAICTIKLISTTFKRNIIDTESFIKVYTLDTLDNLRMHGQEEVRKAVDQLYDTFFDIQDIEFGQDP